MSQEAGCRCTTASSSGVVLFPSTLTLKVFGERPLDWKNEVEKIVELGKKKQ